jgi:hypothetical protein
VADLRQVVSEQVKLQPGMSLSYSGQFEFLERANARLKWVIPATLLIIFVLLYLTFSRLDEALLIMATLPFALSGGAWFLYLLGFNLSVATGVGFIALAGVSAEFGVIMLLYLKNAWAERDSGRGPQRTGTDGCDPRGRSAAGSTESNDRGGDYRRVAADPAGQWLGQRSDEPHRRANGRRHGHRATAFAAGHSCRLPTDATSRVNALR